MIAMKAEVATRPLWKLGDIVAYKSYGITGLTCVILGRYKDVGTTKEPQYVIGILELSYAQRSRIKDDNLNSVLSILRSGMSGSLPSGFAPVAEKAIHRFFSDWQFQRVFDQESEPGRYRMWCGGSSWYRHLTEQGYQMLPVDMEDYTINTYEPRYGKRIISVHIVMQHSLRHPLENTKMYKTKKSVVQDRQN